MFNISRTGDGDYTLNYFGYRWVIRIYECSKRGSSLEDEINDFKEIIKDIFAIIPTQAIKTPISLLIGTIMFNTNSSLTTRFRNKGLVLSMFITGRRQLYETVEILRKTYVESNSYYLVVIHSCGESMAPLKECKPLNIEQSVKDVDINVLKNIYGLISVL